MNDCAPPGKELKLAQNSMLKSFVPKSHAERCGTDTYPLLPLKLNACPTSPFVNVTPPTKVPLLVPCMSLALPSPGHQATMPVGGGMHTLAAVMMKAVGALVTCHTDSDGKFRTLNIPFRDGYVMRVKASPAFGK